jgi:hypothetical protein
MRSRSVLHNVTVRILVLGALVLPTACGSCDRTTDGWDLFDHPPESQGIDASSRGGTVFGVLTPDDEAHVPRGETNFGGVTGHGPTGEIDLADSDVLFAEQWDTLHPVMYAGDVDADGYDDLLLGNGQCCHFWDEYEEPGQRGSAYLVYGAARADFARRHRLGDDYAMFLGERRRDRFGQRFAAPGDLNQDGFDDFVATVVRGQGYGEYEEKVPARAYVFYGAERRYRGAIDASEAGLIIEHTGPYFGSVLTGGDYDGDGIGDLMVSKMQWVYPDPTHRLSVYAFYGPLEPRDAVLSTRERDAELNAQTTPDHFTSFATITDADRDGTDELLVGRPETSDSPRSVVLVPGARTRLDRTASLTSGASVFTSNESRSWDVGQPIDNAGDVDGDGAADMLIGARALPDEEGSLFVVAGHAPLHEAYDLGSGEYRGTRIDEDPERWDFPIGAAGGGDVNCDGFDDVLVSAKLGSRGATEVRLYYGRPDFFERRLTLDDADAVFAGPRSDRTGWSMAIDGDLDGDGCDDIVLGGLERRVYVVYGGP